MVVFCAIESVELHYLCMMSTKPKNCGRCNVEISCNAAEIKKCQCSKITISQDTTSYLQETRYDCLCNACLETVDQLVSLSEQFNQGMVQGIHYYVENGMYVFTELYHIQRGYCCGSRCRHCAYGLAPDKTINQI